MRSLISWRKVKNVCKSNFLWQHHAISSAGYSRSFPPEMRYFFLTYTKYACEKLPFSVEKSLAESSCRIVWYCHEKQ